MMQITDLPVGKALSAEYIQFDVAVCDWPLVEVFSPARKDLAIPSRSYRIFPECTIFVLWEEGASRGNGVITTFEPLQLKRLARKVRAR
jgi:hypothetical protein